MTDTQFDLAVIGGGPAGYTAAIRASQLGLKTVCVEKSATLGGACLNVGCVPSKALLESSARFANIRKEAVEHGIEVGDVSLNLAGMMARKDKIVKNITKGVAFLFKKNKVAHVVGTASILAPGRLSVLEASGVTEISCDKIVIAAGALPKTLSGVELDSDSIGDSTTALSYSSVPKHLAVIGAGAVGLELGTVWRRLGASVTVLEFADTVLPGMDSDITKQAARYFKRQKIDVRTGVRVKSVKKKDGMVLVDIDGQEDIVADRVLSAVGRTPNTDGLGLDLLGISVDERGFIQVNDRFETSVHGIYAVGDIIGGLLLAHKASEEAVRCVEGMAGNAEGRLDPNLIPTVVYTEPEIASAGRTEDALRRENTPYIKGEFLFRANARAQGHGDIDGFVKVLADKHTRKLLGAHILGPFAGELIAEAALSLQNGLSVEDIVRTCHAHPTLAECLKEAAAAAINQAIHI